MIYLLCRAIIYTIMGVQGFDVEEFRVCSQAILRRDVKRRNKTTANVDTGDIDAEYEALCAEYEGSLV